MKSLKFVDVMAARERIRRYLTPTPLELSAGLGHPTQQVYFKLENVQPMHSFKIRGALNAVLANQEQALKQGIITASAGNHGQGVAYSAALIGANATIVMPKHAPRRKIEGVERCGGTALLHGDSYDEAEQHARELEQETGRLFISAYNDFEVMAGQGTIALELFEQRPSIRRILIPTSGGGLLGGIALAAKTICPEVEIIGVQSIATPAMYNFFYHLELPEEETIADALSGGIEANSVTLPICQQYVDKIVLVEEAAIAEGIRWMFYKHGWVVEGAAATGIAAIAQRHVEIEDAKDANAKDTAVLISGGNIDADKFLGLIT
jgi:threonine dehydratase